MVIEVVKLYSPTSKQCEDVMSRLQLSREEGWSISLRSLSPESMLVIMNNISKCTVTRLYITKTQLDSECSSKLLEVLSSNMGLETLQISLFSLTGGIKQISDVLINNITLKELLLFDIRLTDEDIIHLSNMISINKTLTELILNKCNITDNGVQYICEGLTKNRTLTELRFDDNPQITSASTSTIAELINTTKSLTELRLDDTSLNNDDIKTICTALVQNTTIQTLHLSKQHEEYCKKLDSYQVIKDRLQF